MNTQAHFTASNLPPMQTAGMHNTMSHHTSTIPKHDMNQSYESSQLMMYEPLHQHNSHPSTEPQPQQPHPAGYLPPAMSGATFSFQNDQRAGGGHQTREWDREQANQLHMMQGSQVLAMPYYQQQQYRPGYGPQMHAGRSAHKHDQPAHHIASNAFQLTPPASHQLPLGLNTFMVPSPASSANPSSSLPPPQGPSAIRADPHTASFANNPFKTIGGAASQHFNMEAIQQTIGPRSTIESHMQRMPTGKENTGTSAMSKGSRHGSRERSKGHKRERSRSLKGENRKHNRNGKEESHLNEAPSRPSKEHRRRRSQELSEQFVCSVQFNEVYVWGDNQYGQLGLGTVQKSAFDPQAAATATESESSSRLNAHSSQEGYTLLPKICCFNTVITKVSCGMSHTLLLSSSGHVYAMGSNQYGQLGLDAPLEEDKQPAKKLLPCLLEKLQDHLITDIQAGNDHSMALTEQGDKLFTWGQGKFGALGLSRSQNMKAPAEVELPPGARILAIAAGARHSAFITEQKKLYVFGLGVHGQLGLGEECTDRAFKPEKVDLGPKNQVEQVALGDTHSLILTSRGYLMSTGANDKYQLGISPEKRSLKLFSFTKIKQFKTGEQTGKMLTHKDVTFKKVFAWNLNAAIDDQDRVYLWGILHDKQVKLSLCIKVPERVNSFTVDNVAIGPTMALLVDKETQQPCVIGVNAKGELGLGDVEQRKTFCILNELKEKKIKVAGVGKSGFVIALADQVIDPEDQLFSPEQMAPKDSVDRREIQVIAEESNDSPSKSPVDRSGLPIQPQNAVDVPTAGCQGLLASSPLTQVTTLLPAPSQLQIQDIQNQVNNLASMSHLNMRMQFLEGQVQKKQGIIAESDDRHASLIDKIEKLEAKLGGMERAERLEKEVQELKAQVRSQKAEQQAAAAEREQQKIDEEEEKKNRRGGAGGRSKSRERSRSGERRQRNDSEAKKDWNSAFEDEKMVEREAEQEKAEYNPMKRKQYTQSQFEKGKGINDGARVPITTRSESHNMAPKIAADYNQEIDLRSQPQAAVVAEFAPQLKQSDVPPRRQVPLQAWEVGRVREGLESQYAREKIQRGDPNYLSEVHRRPESYNARGSEMVPLLRQKSDPRIGEQRYDSVDPTVLSRHSRATRGSSLLRPDLHLDHASTLSNKSKHRIDPLPSHKHRSTSFERLNAARPRSTTSPPPLASLPPSTVALQHHIAVNQMSISPPQKRSLLSNKSCQSAKQGDKAAAVARGSLEAEKLAEAETALYRLKVDYARRDTEAREAEERIKSMTQKLDSLVKFLEEERSLRKKVQGELKEKEQEIMQLTLDQAKAKEGQDRSGEELKNLETNMNSMKEDIDRLRYEKSQAIEEKQEMEHKVIDLESRLRTANKQLAEKEKDFERQLQEKYDAQNKQFLLQQEMSHHTAQQLQFMASAHHNQLEVQRQLVERRKEAPPIGPLNAPSSQDQFAQLSQSQQFIRNHSSNSRKDARSNVHSLEGRRVGQSGERLLMTEKTLNKRDGSHSQDRWSASLRNQTTPQLANSVPQIVSAKPAVLVSQSKPERNNILYSFQQYQDRNYDFIHKRIGSEEEERRRAEKAESTTMEQSRKGSLGSKSRIPSSSLLLGPRDDRQNIKVGMANMMASASVGMVANSIKQESRQSPWSHVKPAGSAKMDLSREMSLEKHHRGTTPTPPENRNVQYISRFGQELKPTSIQEKLENLQRGYRELASGTHGAGSSTRFGAGNLLDARSKSGERQSAQITTAHHTVISANAVDGVPACSTYMKNLQTARPQECVSQKYLAPMLSLSDTQQKRMGEYHGIPPSLRPEQSYQEHREYQQRQQSPGQKLMQPSLRPVSISASERQTETQAQSSSNNPSSAVNRNITAAPAHTSFRSRIESLLPDHLRDQYHVQQQQFQARRQSRDRGLLDAPYERRLPGQGGAGRDEDAVGGVRDLDYYLQRN